MGGLDEGKKNLKICKATTYILRRGILHPQGGFFFMECVLASSLTLRNVAWLESESVIFPIFPSYRVQRARIKIQMLSFSGMLCHFGGGKPYTPPQPPPNPALWLKRELFVWTRLAATPQRIKIWGFKSFGTKGQYRIFYYAQPTYTLVHFIKREENGEFLPQ